jgi:serine-type D-Ala-D-Ala carboxypeptidase (penicillin-binding protein 5/6)
VRALKLPWWAKLAISFVALVLVIGGFLAIEHRQAVSAGVLSPVSGAYTTKNTVDVTWKLAHYHPGSGRVTLLVDGNAVPDSQISLTKQGVQAELQLADGTHTVTVRYTSGNLFARNVTGASVLTIVSTPPALKVLSPSPATALRGRTVHFQARSNRVVVAAQLTVDGRAVPVTVQGEAISAELTPGVGTHELALTVTDQAGNATTERWQATADLHNPAADKLEPPAVQAPSAILVDADDGRVICSKNPDAERAMASTAKIMTALLAFEALPLDTKVTASVRAASVGEQSLGLKPGNTLTVEQLLYGTLVRSANDAAFALAEAVGGNVDAFVAMMNQKAQKLSMTHTHYANPHGLDAPGAQTSAADLALLARVAMQNETFRRITGTVNYSVQLPGAATPFAFRNVNLLLGSVDWVTGVKTGFTTAAGFCLVGSGVKDGHSVISVVLGEPSWNLLWEESQALMEFGFQWETLDAQPIADLAVAPVQAVNAVEPATLVTKLAAPYEPGGEVEVVTKQGLQLAFPEASSVLNRVTMPSIVALPVAAGQVLGREEFLVGGETVGWVDLMAAEGVHKPSVWEKVGHWWHRVTGAVKRAFS